MSIIDYVLKITSKFDSNGFKNLASNLTETQRNILKISTMTAPIFASMTNMAVNFGRQLLESSKNLGAYESRFYAITGDQKSANEELEWTFNLARRTATNINTLTDAYSIFYATARKSLGQENTRLIMQDWAEIARVTHLSGDAFGRVMYAMRELSSKGAIYADDIKRQLGSAVPNAIEHARKAAEDLGITGTDWWEKLQEAAKNNQPLVNKFMIQFTKHAHEALASPEALRESLTKTDSALQNLSNSWEFLKMSIARSEAFKRLVKLFGEFVLWLNEAVKHTEFIKQVLIAFVSVWITLLTYQVFAFFVMLKTQLGEVNIMLAGIPMLIGLIVMGIIQIITHWDTCKKNLAISWAWLKKYSSWILGILAIILGVIGLFNPVMWIGAIIAALGWLVNVIVKNWDTIKDTCSKGLQWIWKGVVWLVDKLYDYIMWVPKTVALVIKKILEYFDILDDHPLLKKILGISQLKLSEIPKAITEETKVTKTQTKTTLDINVNGKNISTSNATDVNDGIDKNQYAIFKEMKRNIRPTK